jgi:hypothetical protein
VAVRRGQQKERQRLLAEISESQKRISALNEQRAPIAAEVRKVEAEVGPIKYIAALIYGDNTDINVLERAVRWVIILLVCVFDPLAIMMLLAATESLKWARKPPVKDISEDGNKTLWPTRPHIPGYDDEYVKWPGGVEPTETTAEKEFDIKDHPYLFTPPGNRTPPGVEPAPIQVYRPSDPELDPCYKCGTPLMNAPGIGPFCPNQECDVSDGPFLDDQEPIKIKYISPTANLDDEHDEDESIEIKDAKSQWKADNPGDTLKRHRRLLEVGVIDQLPWMQYLSKAPESGFGNVLPEHGNKGDTFMSTIGIPHRLYKHNGSEWIRIDNTQQDNYTYDIAYIDHLISQIDQGLYDPDQLSDSEREQIEQRITQTK